MEGYDTVLAEEIIELYRGEGESVRRIARGLRARGLEITENTLRQILRDAGIPDIKGPLGQAKAEIPDLASYAARVPYEPMRSLAREAGVCEATLRRHLQDGGYLIRGQHRKLLARETA